MAQFLCPDGNITQTNFTNGFAEIDETTASDADFAYSANNTTATLEVSLTNPSVPTYIANVSNNCTLRYRIARVNGGVVSNTGNDVTVTASIRTIAEAVATDTAKSTSGTWTTYTLAFTRSGSLASWTDLRIRFVTSASGAGNNARGAAISWAEVEVPDAVTTKFYLTS